MYQQEKRDQYSNRSCGVKSVNEEHCCHTGSRASSSSPPFEVVERRSEIRCRADLQQEASEIGNEERHQISHGDKRSNTVDVKQHGDLSDDMCQKDSVY